MDYNTITKPTLLLDSERARRNICQMRAKADKLGLQLRPHAKTHQSAGVGEWFRELGNTRITVSSVDMAAYFAENGFTDITLAFPVNIREIDRINRLMESVRLHLLVESAETVEFLNDKLSHPADFFIKIDTGYHRAGLMWDDHQAIRRVAEAARPEKLRFRGFLTHDGRTYKARGKEEVAAIHQKNLHRFRELKALFQEDWQDIIVSYGDTPTASLMEDFTAMDELRPGNYVFYDLMQQQVGSCDYADIAVALAVPVVAKHSARNELVVYGGAVHLSKDRLEHPEYGAIYGMIAEHDETGWGDPYPGVYLARLSQEHGIVKAPDAFIQSVQVGDLLLVLPVHSCLTADLMPGYLTLEGEWIHIMGK